MFFITPPNNYYNPVFKLCNWLNSNLGSKILSSFASIGIDVYVQNSILDIIKAVPNYSIFIVGIPYNHGSIAEENMPTGFKNGGTLIITKINNKITVWYIRNNKESLLSSPEIYFANVMETDCSSIKWSKIATSDADTN